MSETRGLTVDQLQQYNELGYCAPIRVLSTASALRYRARYDAYSAPLEKDLDKLEPRLQYAVYEGTQLSWRWAYDLMTEPAVLDAVESIIGPNIILWATKWFTKRAHENAVVTWHQDEAYWGFTPPNAVTAWIALSPTNPENGCLRVIRESHLGGMRTYEESGTLSNVLLRGQEIGGVDLDRAVDLCLQPGEMSLHHMREIHGSGPNRSDVPRIGIAPRYVAPEVRQSGPHRPEGILVRGEDRFGHWKLLEPPADDNPDEEREAARIASIERVRANAHYNAEHSPYRVSSSKV